MSVRAVGPIDVGAFTWAEKAATLEDVLAACRARSSAVIDVVVQDEFTHDVIVQAPHSAYLVFDTT